MKILNSFVAAAVLATSVASWANTVTHEGTVDKVVPAKKEIYVLSEGKKLELYFNDKTEVVNAGKTGTFEDLKTQQKVRVTANKIGKRLDPVKVEILQ